MGSSSMPGYRFHPTEEELVGHFLKQKMLGNDNQVSRIAQVDVNNYEPWDLPNYSVIRSDDPEWYFFSPRKTKYRNSQRADRTTKGGFWKPTGKDRVIRDSNTGEEIGIKKTLVFYQGRVSKGAKSTPWVMHEYNPTFQLPNKRGDFVLCKLKNNSDDYAPSYESRSSVVANSVFENQIPNDKYNFSDYHQDGRRGHFNPTMDNNYNYDYNFPQVDPQLQAHVESFRDYPPASYNLNAALGSTIYSPGGSYYYNN